MIDLVMQYWSDRGTTVDKPQLERAFQRYENRSDEDRKMEPHAYWGKFSSTVNLFLEDLEKALLSEASVERTFHKQKREFFGERNRMHPDLLNDVLFIAMNCQKLSSTTRRSLSHSSAKPNIASLTAWQSLIFSIEAPAGNDGVHTRHKERHDLAMNLPIGSRVKIAYWDTLNGVQTGSKTYYTATVIHGTMGDYQVIFDYNDAKKEKPKIAPFKPTAEDKDWEQC